MDSKKERRVYILVDGGHNYSDAERFGTLVYLHIPLETRWDISSIFPYIAEGLKDAQEDDLILISGMTSICCVATALMVEWYGKVHFLIFRKDRYEEHVLDLANRGG